MDSKEQILLNNYREKFNKNIFTEYDIYGFLVLIRNYIKQFDKKYKYIIEFCDLVAHRERDRGIIMEQICTMINVKYKVDSNGMVKGFSGINDYDWKKEWELLSKALKLSLTERNINEITMCIYSLAQDTLYKTIDKKTKKCVHHKGYVKLYFDDFNNIYLLCTVGRKKSKFVVLAKSKNCISNIKEKGLIDKTIILSRDYNGNLIQKYRRSWRCITNEKK